MLKIFRNIRQKMVAQSRIRNYMLYALGEIILVVIGILIALQINTWNQNRLNRIEEQKILKNLKADFENNKALLEAAKKKCEEGISYCLAMLNYTGNKEKPKTARAFDSILNNIFTSPNYSPLSGTLDELINSGKLGVLRSEDLRKKISSWKPGLEVLKGRYGENQDYLDNINDFMVMHGNWLNADKTAKTRSVNFPKSGFEFDNRTLLQNQEFENLVENVAIGLDNYLNRLNQTSILLDDILNLINTNIKND